MFVAVLSVYLFLVYVLKEAIAVGSISSPLNLRVFLIHCNVLQQRGNSDKEDLEANNFDQIKDRFKKLYESESNKVQLEVDLCRQVKELWNEIERDKEERAALWAQIKKNLQEPDELQAIPSRMQRAKGSFPHPRLSQHITILRQQRDYLEIHRSTGGMVGRMVGAHGGHN
jgi:hypothetical protein